MLLFTARKTTNGACIKLYWCHNTITSDSNVSLGKYFLVFSLYKIKCLQNKSCNVQCKTPMRKKKNHANFYWTSALELIIISAWLVAWHWQKAQWDGHNTGQANKAPPPTPTPRQASLTLPEMLSHISVVNIIWMILAISCTYSGYCCHLSTTCLQFIIQNNL